MHFYNAYNSFPKRKHIRTSKVQQNWLSDVQLNRLEKTGTIEDNSISALKKIMIEKILKQFCAEEEFRKLKK